VQDEKLLSQRLRPLYFRIRHFASLAAPPRDGEKLIWKRTKPLGYKARALFPGLSGLFPDRPPWPV
jgi:hypothetical protein